MKIGFATALTNDFDAKAVVQKLVESEVGVELEFEEAPTILNTPAAVKKLFSRGLDACIVFVQSSDEEKMSLALAQEKIVDVEKEFAKYCIVCTVLDEEGNTEALAEERLRECIQLLLGVRPEKSALSTGLDFFGTPGAGPQFFNPAETSGGSEGSATSPEGKPLF